MHSVRVHILDGFFAGSIVTVKYDPGRPVFRLYKNTDYSETVIVDDLKGAMDISCLDKDFQDYVLRKNDWYSVETYLGVCTVIMMNTY